MPHKSHFMTLVVSNIVSAKEGLDKNRNSGKQSMKATPY